MKTLLLLKVQLKQRYSLKAMTTINGSGRGDNMKRLGMTVLLIYAVGMMLFLYCSILDAFLNAAVSMMYPELVLDLVVMAAMALCAVFGIMTVLSVIYLSRDAQMLSALPVPTRSIFLSKFLMVYISELAVNLLFMLPALILYAVRVNAAVGAGVLGMSYHVGVAFFLRGLLVSLAMPIIPLLVSTVLVSLIMLPISRMRRKETVLTVMSFILVIGVFVLQMFINGKMTAGASEGEFFGSLFTDNWSKLNSVVMPPFSWAANGIYAGGYGSLISLVLFGIATLIAFFIVYAVAGGIYSFAVSRAGETARRNRRMSAQQDAKDESSKCASLVKKEWRVMLRSPVYATNSLTGIAFAIVIFFVPALMGEGGSGITAFIKNVNGNTSAMLVAGLIALFSSMNMGATTVMSREGRSLSLLRALPLSGTEVAKAKLLFGITLPLLWAVPIAVCAFAVLGMPLWSALLALAEGMLLSVIITVLGVMIDFARPKLIWIEEAEAIKQNMNGVLGMLIGVGVTLVFALPVFLLVAKTELPLWVINAALTALAAAAAIFSYRAALVFCAKAYEKTEI